MSLIMLVDDDADMIKLTERWIVKAGHETICATSGPEALDMLSAMNTGHEGSLSTGHSNSAEDMISRIETMVLMGASLPMAAIRQQIASAIDLFVYITRMAGGQRRVTQIMQVSGMQDGNVWLEPLFSWQENRLLRTEAALRRRKGIFQTYEEGRT